MLPTFEALLVDHINTLKNWDYWGQHGSNTLDDIGTWKRCDDPRSALAVILRYVDTCEDTTIEGVRKSTYGRLCDDGNKTIGYSGRMWAYRSIIAAGKGRKSLSFRGLGGTVGAMKDFLPNKTDDNSKRHDNVLYTLGGICSKNTNAKNGLVEWVNVSVTDVAHCHSSMRKECAAILTQRKRNLETAQVETQLDDLAEKWGASPEQYAYAIAAEFGIDIPNNPVAHWHRPKHDFHPRLEQFVAHNDKTHRSSTTLTTYAKSLAGKLRAEMEKSAANQQGAHAATVILHGPEQSGKKGIIGEFLRTCHSSGTAPDNVVSFPTNIAGGPPQHIPILALPVQRQSYSYLVSYVLAFLKRCRNGAAPTERLDPIAREIEKSCAHTDGIDTVLSEIKRLHAHAPVLFIFTDLLGVESDSFNRLLFGSGFYRLFHVLRETNPLSAIIITSPHRLGHGRGISNTNHMQIGSLKLPTFDWYLSDHDLENFCYDTFSSAVVEWQATTGVDPIIPTENIDTNGDELLLLAVLYSLTQSKDDFWPILSDVIRRKLKNDDKGHLDETLVAQLLESLNSMGLLMPVLLIGATRISGDDLSQESLEAMMSQLQKRNDWPDNVAGIDLPWHKTLEKLSNLSKIGRGFFISTFSSNIKDTEERGPLETGEGTVPFWTGAGSLFRSIFDIVLCGQDQNFPTASKHADALRLALRVVATAARRRAQIKRLNRANDDLGTDQYNTMRNIQAYVTLLSSLPMHETPILDIHSTPLRLALGHVFSTDKKFDPNLAYRFAVLVLLKDEIDANHRLTMQTDQDELRTRLYLNAIYPEAIVGGWHLTDHRSVNKDLSRVLERSPSPYFVNALSLPEQLDVWLSLCLASFHSHAFPLVALAYKHAKEVIALLGDSASDRDISNFVRIQCTKVDCALLNGLGPECEGEPAMDLLAMNDWLHKTINDFNDLHRINGENTAELEGTSTIKRFRSATITKAYMRLEARLAELSWLITSDRAGSTLRYENIEQLERSVAHSSGDHNLTVMSGRTARRFMRFMSFGYPVLTTELDETSRSNNSWMIRTVIEANIARLDKFSGADRIGVLLDQARYHAFSGNIKTAAYYANKARSRVRSSRISHGGKLEVFALSAAIGLLQLDSEPPEEMEQLRVQISDDIEKYLKISNWLESRTSYIIGKFLHVRLQCATPEIVCSDHGKKGILKQKAILVNEADSIGFGLAKTEIEKFYKKLA